MTSVASVVNVNRRQFIILSVYLCVQNERRDNGCRAVFSAAVEICCLAVLLFHSYSRVGGIRLRPPC